MDIKWNGPEESSKASNSKSNMEIENDDFAKSKRPFASSLK